MSRSQAPTAGMTSLALRRSSCRGWGRSKRSCAPPASPSLAIRKVQRRVTSPRRDQSRLRAVSLATDGFVSERNARDPGVPQRVFLPASIGEAVDGHGGSLTNHEIGAVVTETVRSHAIPPDRRDLPTLLLTPIVWPLAAHLWLRLLAAAVALSIGLALVRQFTPLRGRIDWFARRCTGYLRLRGR